MGNRTKQLKLKSKMNNEFIYVQVTKNKIVSNKHGFVPVKNSPIYVDLMNQEFIEKWYHLPDGITL